MMFAQIPEAGSYQAIGWTIVTVAGLATAANQILKLVDRFKGKGQLIAQPLEVTEAHAPVREKDCIARHAQVERQIDEVRRQRSEDIKDASESRRGLYQKIESVQRDLTEKIESMPAQIVAGLLNSKRLFNGDNNGNHH